MLIEIERLDIKLENESKGWFYPVIALSGSASAELNNWSNEVSRRFSRRLQTPQSKHLE